jgi:hypothetical protein
MIYVTFTVLTPLTIINPYHKSLDASGTEAKEIGNWIVNKGNELLGQLWIDVTAGKPRFLFSFANVNDCETIPCYIALQCKDKNGKIHSDIILKEIYSNDPENGELIIMSDIIPDFDYSEVEILKGEGLPTKQASGEPKG